MALAKFDFEYKNAWQDEIGFNTLVTQFENGKEQRRSKGLPRRKFTLEFDKTTNYNDDAQAMWDFFVARKGKFEPFLWDKKDKEGNIIEANIKVRFNQDILNREVFKYKAFSYGLELIEVIE